MGYRNRSFIGYLEGTLSIIINTVLFILKYWVGIKTGSVAIIADAWHTISDSFSSVVVLWGFKTSAKPPDKQHPFGHGRVEIISAVIIGAILAVVGFNFLIESVERFISRQAASYSTLAIIVFIISIVLKEGIAQFSFWGGKKIDSRSLIADGWHHRSDAIASFLILIGMFLGRYFWWIDSVLGISVSLLIFWTTYGILKHSIDSLIGEEPDEKLKQALNRLITRKTSQNISIHHIHLHQYGNHKELTFHIKLPPDIHLKKAHDIADDLEKRIKEEMDIESTIHIEPH